MRNGSVGRRLTYVWAAVLVLDFCAIFVGSFRQEKRRGIGMVRTVDKLLVVELTYIIPRVNF